MYPKGRNKYIDKAHLLPPLYITPPFSRNRSYGANTTPTPNPPDSIAIYSGFEIKWKFIAD